jgi:putative transposase
MTPRLRKLPRLERGCYRGIGASHWIFSLEDRATGWLTPGFHAHFREMLTHTTARFACAAPVYCLMPEHLHLMLWNLREDSDSYLAARFLRKHTSNALLPARYQKQAYDHVLDEKEQVRPAFEAVCHYILENPVRAGICLQAQDYPFSNSLIPGYPELRVHDPGYWELFWRILCGMMDRP